MATVDVLLATALQQLGDKPDDSAPQAEKKRYSERMSEVIAQAIAEELRNRGCDEARPTAPGILDSSGAERRMAGGLGAKKVDVTWATEEAGLLLAVSIKTINFKDGRSANYQKNLINRRGDLLMEAVTLHRRFPYSVLAAFFFLDHGSEHDGTDRRKSTFKNAHPRLRLFTGREDPAGRDEQFEKFYLVSVNVTAVPIDLRAYEVGKPDTAVSFDQILNDLLSQVAERTPDSYEFDSGKITKVSG